MLAACKQAFFAESPTKLWTFRLVIIKCTEDLHSRRKDSPKKTLEKRSQMDASIISLDRHLHASELSIGLPDMD